MDALVEVGVRLVNAETGDVVVDEQVIISDTTDDGMRSALATWLAAGSELLLERLPPEAWPEGDPGGWPRDRFMGLTWNWLFWCWISAVAGQVQDHEKNRLYQEGTRLVKAQVDGVTMGILHGITERDTTDDDTGAVVGVGAAVAG